MSHNMTVTIDDPLWKEMKRHNEIRWSAVMKEAVKSKIKALSVLNRLMKDSKLTENEIEDFATKLGKKVSNRR